MTIGKVSGPSGVFAEMMIAEKEFRIEWLTDLCNDIMGSEGKTPTDWKRSSCGASLQPWVKVIHWNVDHTERLNSWNRQGKWSSEFKNAKRSGRTWRWMKCSLDS